MHDLIGVDDLVGSVVRVGDGRGFVVHTNRGNYVITATHCLPTQPSAPRFLNDETYPRLVGPRNGEPHLTVTCLFADPVGDSAVLGPPDDQEFSDEYKAYEAFTMKLQPFKIAAPPPDSLDNVAQDSEPADIPVPAYMLSLEGAWLDCHATYYGGPLWIKPEESVVAGMSGSPLIDANGAVMGVLSINGIAACLHNDLPGWLLRALACG